MSKTVHLQGRSTVEEVTGVRDCLPNMSTDQVRISMMVRNLTDIDARERMKGTTTLPPSYLPSSGDKGGIWL